MSHQRGGPSLSSRALRCAVLGDVQVPREELMRECLEALAGRGIDGEALLRYGMTPELIGPVVVRAVLAQANIDQRAGNVLSEPELMDTLPPSADDSWDVLFSASASLAGIVGTLPRPAEAPPELIARIIMATAWIAHAPLDALLERRGPTAEELAAAMAADPLDLTVRQQYRWMLERFSVTSLAEWSTSSLHAEYRYRRGFDGPACAPHLMEDRRIPDVALDTEIARRATRPDGTERDLKLPMALHMQKKATELLRNGQHRAAAALFEFAVDQGPHDAMAHNNLGFCLLLDDPQRALEHLSKAEALGYQPATINIYNQVFGLARLEQFREALALAERRWPEVSEEPDHEATLWVNTDDDGCAVEFVASGREQLRALCEDLAQHVGHDDATERWRQRRAS